MPTNSAENVREFYRKQGEERERERIIKLLRLDEFHHIEFESVTLRAGDEPRFLRKHSGDCLVCDAIALINGGTLPYLAISLVEKEI